MALNMETNYCGFRCENPFILASSPVSATGEMICRAFEEADGLEQLQKHFSSG